MTVKKFRTWAERRQFNRDMKRKQAESERPILPANQKLITLSVQDAPTKKGKKEAPLASLFHYKLEFEETWIIKRWIQKPVSCISIRPLGGVNIW